MQCYTQEKIAEIVGVTHQTASNYITKFAKSSDFGQICKDFTPQLYNIWNFARNNTFILSFCSEDFHKYIDYIHRTSRQACYDMPSGM